MAVVSSGIYLFSSALNRIECEAVAKARPLEHVERKVVERMVP